MGKYFGTDGFRGEAGKTLTAEHAYAIGKFLGWYYAKDGKHKTRVVVGKDTRRSSYMLEYAIVAGLTASGANVAMLHVTTTPNVCFATANDDFDCGIMISASHNSFEDNGIKLINDKGEKIDDNAIAEIENYIDGNYQALGLPESGVPNATGDNLGEIEDYAIGRNRYIGYLISTSRRSFKTLKIGLDCANGSSWMVAKNVFETLGAKVTVINASPNGLNINKNAGSTHIEGLCDCVRENHLDLGFAFDGDADRCIAVDENGAVVNGDQIMYILAKELKKDNQLVNNTVVTTVMSNLGLYKALDKEGISYVQTKVGDRFVHENMAETGNCLGGEQSGHIILSKYATTGDGILTAIKVAQTVVENKTTLGKLAEPCKMLPQVLKNVKVPDREKALADKRVCNIVEALTKELADNGRILLRPSGTEPIIRVMAEALDKKTAEDVVDKIIAVIQEV